MKSEARELRLPLALAALTVLSLAGCGNAPLSGQPAAPGLQQATSGKAPDLASCSREEGNMPSEVGRAAPLAIPAALSGVAASDLDHIAVSTLSGRTLCVDAGWIAAIENMELSADGRFVSFEWYGYEEFGYQLIDRYGTGAALETGVRPIHAPSGDLIAALEYSDSGFGSLNALGIWRTSVEPAQEVAIVELPEGLTDWRFDGWRGDDCIAASASSFEQLGEDGINRDEATRRHFLSRQADGWKLEPAGSASCGTP